SRGEPRPVGTEGRTEDPLGVPGEVELHLAGHHIPDLNATEAGQGDAPAVAVEGDAVDAALDRSKLLPTRRPARRLPEPGVPSVQAAVAAIAGEQRRAIGGEGHTHDGGRRLDASPDRPAGRHLPDGQPTLDLRLTIPAPRGEPLSVGADGHALDRSGQP